MCQIPRESSRLGCGGSAGESGSVANRQAWVSPTGELALLLSRKNRTGGEINGEIETLEAGDMAELTVTSPMGFHGEPGLRRRAGQGDIVRDAREVG